MIGQTLSHFRITAKLGQGGMGEVYLAEDLELKREVALKVLPAELASDPDRIARFQREAESLAALNHPNIVTIFSIEQAGDRRLLSMELVRGRNLADVIESEGRDKGLELERIFAIAIPLADALAAAHGRGVIHRDLKPANLMLTDEGRLKILDFGLAKLRAAPDEDDSRMETMAMTREGVILGTAPYMSPEQVEGERVDHRADIFSLGIVLYELATGRRPFTGKSAPAVMSAILKDSPPPVEELRSDLPDHLGRVIRRCLEKDPSRRYQAALDVRHELESLRTELATTGSRPAPLGQRAKRRRIAGLAVAGVGLLVALALWQWLARTRPTRGDPDGEETARIVVVPFDNLGLPEDDYFAAGITDEITSRLSAVPELGVVSRRSALDYTATTKSPREIGEDLGVEYVLFGSVRWASTGADIGRVRITPELVRTADGQQVWSQAYDRVIDDIFEVQSDIAGQVLERLGMTLGTARPAPATAPPTANPEAYTLYLKGRHFWNKRTEDDIQRGLSYFEQAVDLDPSYALAWVGIADTWIFRGFYSVLAPSETFPRAREAADRALAADGRLAEAHASRGHISFEFDHDWTAAEISYRRAIELDPKYSIAHHWYGGFLSAMGRHEEALEQAHLARQLDPLSPIISTWVGLRHYFARRYDMAIEEYERTLELAPDFAPCLWHLGWALEQLGRSEEAIVVTQKAIEATAGDPLYVASLGYIYALQGEVAQAEQILVRLDRLGAERHVSAYHTAVIHAALGAGDEAFRWLDEAFEERSPWIGYIAVDPRLDPLREDPRFAGLIRRAGLPHAL